MAKITETKCLDCRNYLGEQKCKNKNCSALRPNEDSFCSEFLAKSQAADALVEQAIGVFPGGTVRKFETDATVKPEIPRYGHPEFYKLLDQMAELHSRKNHDYAGESDPLKNLRSPKRIGIDPFVGVMIRLQDKWSRLEEFLNSKTLLVKNESVEDTLMDNAVYSLLAIILLREQKENKSE